MVEPETERRAGKRKDSSNKLTTGDMSVVREGGRGEDGEPGRQEKNR